MVEKLFRAPHPAFRTENHTMAREDLPTRSEPAKYQKARRKRQRARQMRRGVCVAGAIGPAPHCHAGSARYRFLCGGHARRVATRLR